MKNKIKDIYIEEVHVGDKIISDDIHLGVGEVLRTNYNTQFDYENFMLVKFEGMTLNILCSIKPMLTIGDNVSRILRHI